MLTRLKTLKVRAPIRWAILVFVGVTIGTVDIAGTPLSLLALGKTQSTQRAGEAATVQARKEDCEEGEKLRARGRARIHKEEAELPSTLKLLHVVDTTAFLAKAEKFNAEGLVQLAHVDCNAYANKAKAK